MTSCACERAAGLAKMAFHFETLGGSLILFFPGRDSNPKSCRCCCGSSPKLRRDDRGVEQLLRAAILGQLHIAEHLGMALWGSVLSHCVLGQGLTGYQVAVSLESARHEDDEADCCVHLESNAFRGRGGAIQGQKHRRQHGSQRMHIEEHRSPTNCECSSGGLHASTGGSPRPALRRVAAAPGAGDRAPFAKVTLEIGQKLPELFSN